MQRDNYILIKSAERPGGYRVSDKEVRSYILFDNEAEVLEIIRDLLANGAEVFETEEDYAKKYPPLGREKIREMGMEYWIDNIPMDKWPEDVVAYHSKKSTDCE